MFVGVKVEALEQMVDMTSKLFECDRDEMFSYLLRLYGECFFCCFFPHFSLTHTHIAVCFLETRSLIGLLQL